MNRMAAGMLVAAAALLPVSITAAQEGPGDAPRHEGHRGSRPGGDGGDGYRAGPPRGGGQHDGGGPGRRGIAGDSAGFGGTPPGGDRTGFGAGGRSDATVTRTYSGRPFGDRPDPRFGGNQGRLGDRGAFDHGGRDDRGRPSFGGGNDDRGGPGRPAFPRTGGQGGYRPQPGQPGFHGGDWRHSDGPGFAPGAPRWGNYGHGGGWTRGWRDDRRYDWHSYRTENHFVFNLPRYYAPRGWGYGYRRFDIGVTIGAPFFAADYWIDDPYVYRLPAAYGPYRWVRYYNDALLVDLRSGSVVDAVYGIFW